MSLLPNVEAELLRVAYAPAGRSPARERSRWGLAGPSRLSGALPAAAVVILALMIGAGFLIALHGSGAGGGSAPATHPPRVSHGAFPGAPRSSQGRFTKRGYVCRRAPRNRYLPRNAGCISVLRVDMTGAGRPDLVLLYADLGTHGVDARYPASRFTLEVVQPGGHIARTRVRSEPFPWITRVGNINGVAGDELVLHLDDVSSGDIYGIYTFHAGRITLVRPTLSAGGDSAAKEGFVCGGASPPRVVSLTMILLGPTIHGRWRWTVTNYDWHGATLRRAARRMFVSRGLPKRRDTVAGAGCGRPTGATQEHP